MDKQAVPQVRNTASRALEMLHKFWCWWSGELLGMLPVDLFDRFQSRKQYMIVELQQELCAIRFGSKGHLSDLAKFSLDASALSLGALPDYAATANKADEVIILLPPQMLLCKPLTLPLATLPNLDNVLKFEMDRYTPFTADKVYFGYRVTARNTAAQTLDLVMVVSPKSELDPILEQLENAGIRATVVAPAADASGELYGMNLLPGTPKKTGLKAMPALKLLVLLALCVLLIFLPLQWQEASLNQLRDAINAPRQEAEAAQKISAQLKTLSEGKAFLVNRKGHSVSRLELLDEVTRLLPDHTWINSLQLDGNTLKLQGESTDASSLISLLEASELLQNVRFSSPVTLIANTQKGRFAVIADVSKEST